MRPFRDRHDAGRQLARALSGQVKDPDVLVLGLPRGGLPVAFEVAAALEAPLDVFVVRKLGVPGQEELAMGAVASGGLHVLYDPVIKSLGITDDEIETVLAHEMREIERREQIYRGARETPAFKDRTLIVVDDGLATGSTMLAAVRALRRESPHRLIVAVPVAPAVTCASLRPEVDQLLCLMSPEPYYGVGQWYEDFTQVSDEEVRALLTRDPSMDKRPSSSDNVPQRGNPWPEWT